MLAVGRPYVSVAEGIIVNLDREYLLKQAEGCRKNRDKFRRDFERDKRRGYNSLANYYTIMARIARYPDLGKLPQNVVDLLNSAENFANWSEEELQGNKFEYSSGLDNANYAVTDASLAEELLQDA